MVVNQADLAALGRGMAVLTTCLVQELSKADLTFEARFLERLSEACYELRDNGEPDPGITLALLASTRSLITGFDGRKGQCDPFLAGRCD